VLGTSPAAPRRHLRPGGARAGDAGGHRRRLGGLPWLVPDAGCPGSQPRRPSWRRTWRRWPAAMRGADWRPSDGHTACGAWRGRPGIPRSADGDPAQARHTTAPGGRHRHRQLSWALGCWCCAPACCCRPARPRAPRL